MNKSRFAAYAGVTKAAITKAVRDGRINIVDDDIDPDHPSNVDYVDMTRARKGLKPLLRLTKDDLRPKKNYESVDEKENLDRIDTATATKLKLIEQIKHTNIKNLEMRRKLISRELVETVFNKLYLVDQNELKPIGQKIAPDIAAIFGSSDRDKILKAGDLIESEIYKSLKHIKRILDDFLKSTK